MVSTAAPDSTLFNRYPSRQVKDRNGAPTYFRLSGTSMATAVASGTIALMVDAAREAHKGELTPNAIKAILQYTAQAYDYDLVILDVMIPGQDGFAVCRDIRAQGMYVGFNFGDIPSAPIPSPPSLPCPTRHRRARRGSTAEAQASG